MDVRCCDIFQLENARWDVPKWHSKLDKIQAGDYNKKRLPGEWAEERCQMQAVVTGARQTARVSTSLARSSTLSLAT